MGVSWVWPRLVVNFFRKMILKQEINRIKKELVDINYRMLYGKTLTELIEEIILKYS